MGRGRKRNGLLRDTEGRLLFVRQAYGKQFWGVPGGVVDIGETPLAAAVREAAEEIGAEVRLTGVVGCYLLTGGGWPDIQAYVFMGEVVSGAPGVVNPQEISEVLWL